MLNILSHPTISYSKLHFVLESANSENSRIAFFLQNLEGGGAERAISSLAGEIATQGYFVDLAVGDANTDYRSEIGSDESAHPSIANA